MANVTIASAVIPNWQYGGTTALLNIYPQQSFIPSGSTSEIQQGSVSRGSWYQSVTCTVSGTNLTIPEFTLPATVDSNKPLGTWLGVFFSVVSGVTTKREAFGAAFRLPHLPSSTTWAGIRNYNTTATAPGAGDQNWTNAPAEMCIACSDETSDLIAGTAKVTFRTPYAMTLTSVRASVNTAPTGSTLVVDINESGTSILSTKLSIDASEKTSSTAAVPVVISDGNLAHDAEMTIDIDQIGATVAGRGLKVWLIGTRA